MRKIFKDLSFGFAVLAVVVGVGAAQIDAALTLSNLAVDSAAGDALTIGASNTTGTIAIGAANTGGITIGNGATVKTISIGAGNAINTIKIGDHATPVNVITIGGAASSLALTDAQWSITSPGVGTLVNLLVSPSATTGVDTGSAGALSIGRVNATSVVIGNAATTAITLTTDGTGDGTDVVLPTGAIATAEILDNTVGVLDLAASLAFVDADLVSFASVSVTDATEGLILPQHATDCSTAGTAEGQVCWEADANTLYIGNGATVTQAIGNVSGSNTWTGTNTYSNTVTVGVDATGYDVKLFGDTTNKFMVWDQSADDLILADAVALQLGGDEATADGFKVEFDGTDTLDIWALTANDSITIGDAVDTDLIVHSASGAALTLDASANTIAIAIPTTASALLTANGGFVEDYSTGVRADAFSAAGLNVIRADATTANLATITGGAAGQIITIIFDDDVVVTDDNANGANAINLVGTGNLTTADDDVLQLVSDGTSWYEISRSVNN